MNGKKIVQLTKELYHLTLLFPKKEPLRQKMRALANDVLAHFISLSQRQNNEKKKLEVGRKLGEELQILDSFFQLAKSQNWLKDSQLSSLQKRYQLLKKYLPNFSFSFSPLTAAQRRKRILEFLRKEKKVQVWQIGAALPQVSKRTIRRDLSSLLKKGIIKRIGQGNTTFYQL